jgi:predicted small secreted protein
MCSPIPRMMRQMRRVANVFFLCSILLTACSRGGGEGVSCIEDYWDDTVGVCLPAGWEVIGRETLRQRGVPEETLVAFQAKEALSGQFPTVAITREVMPQAATPSDFSSAAIRSVSILPGYTLIDARETRLDGAGVQLHIFSAQPTDDEPRRRYYQISTTDGSTGYTVTATAPVAIDEMVEAQIVKILRSFTLEAPEEK